MIEFKRKDFGIGDCFVSKLFKKKVHHLLHLVELWLLQEHRCKSYSVKDKVVLNLLMETETRKIISNRNVCGQIVLENVYMTQGWEVGVDNITEADVLEYYEFLKTTPQYGRIEYNMDAGIMELHPRELDVLLNGLMAIF